MQDNKILQDRIDAQSTEIQELREQIQELRNYVVEVKPEKNVNETVTIL